MMGIKKSNLFECDECDEGKFQLLGDGIPRGWIKIKDRVDLEMGWELGVGHKEVSTRVDGQIFCSVKCYLEFMNGLVT